MSYYLATHQASGNALFSDRKDARDWVEYQADYHQESIDRWVTHGEEESLRLTDSRTYVGTVRSLTLDKHAEHRQYEAEQRDELREAQEAAEAAEVEQLRELVTELEQQLADAAGELNEAREHNDRTCEAVTRAEQAEAERDRVQQAACRTAENLRKAEQRAEQAEAKAEAMTRAMESTAADALRHGGCHRTLMAQCLRAERAEAAIERVRARVTAWTTGTDPIARAMGEDILNDLDEAQQPTEIEQVLGHADDGQWHDVTDQQPSTTETS